MAKKKKNKKIVRYRRPLNLNVGVIIFAIIFIYMSFSVYTYIRKDKIQFYEVAEGGIVSQKDYTGIALREESVQVTDRSGYINYYVREGKRASVGTRIYSIDESGSMEAMLEENPDAAVNLTDRNLADIKRQLSAFSMNSSNVQFDEIYDLQYTMEATVLEYANFNALGQLDRMLQDEGTSFFQVTAPVAGVVSYAIDGFENLQPSEVHEELFSRSDYSKAITKAGQLVEQSAPVYKLVTSDNWSVVFPLSEEDVEEYSGKTSLTVRFASTDLEASGAFSIVSGSDGKPYGKLDFNKYMVQFISDRYISFEVVSRQEEGLKIPATAVTTKNFYLVPVSYLTQGGDSSESGFMKEVYSEAGTTYSFVPTTIYYSTDEFYYIDAGEQSSLQAGDYIVKQDSNERYQIGPTATLEGVYNINKGYAVFKQIEVLSSNEEYYTVQKGTSYGLSVYDHIVLDASTVYEGQLIYQ